MSLLCPGPFLIYLTHSLFVQAVLIPLTNLISTLCLSSCLGNMNVYLIKTKTYAHQNLLEVNMALSWIPQVASLIQHTYVWTPIDQRHNIVKSTVHSCSLYDKPTIYLYMYIIFVYFIYYSLSFGVQFHVMKS